MNRALALPLLALAACSVGPKYQRPDVQVPAETRFAPPAKDGASIADLAWWELFKDPVLQALIREALQANQDLALAVARVEEARAVAGVARADLYPQIGLSAAGSYGQQLPKSVTPGVGPSPVYSASLGVSWELDIWGRVRHLSDAGLANLLAQEDARRGVVLSLVSDLAQAYLELRELDLELEIARQNTATRMGTLDLFTKRARGGIANDLEVNQARADLAVTAAAIPQTEWLIALKENQICVLLGRTPGPIPRGRALVDQVTPPELPAGVPAALLQRRPDLLQAEQVLVAANALVGVAVADRLPTITLSGSVGLWSRSIPDLGSPEAILWNLGAGLFAPIFQGGRLASAEEAARARYEQAVASYRKTAQTAFGEVSNAAIGHQKLRAVRLEQEIGVQANSDAARLALHRYEGGVSGYLEVLDAQRQLFTAQLSLAQTQRDELATVIQLYRALGGGWQEPARP